MKPNIDLNNTKVKEAIAYYRKKVIEALEVPQKVESAVAPIYQLPEFNRKPIQIASGVFVKIKNEFFILSASHVFDEIGTYQLLVGDGTVSEIQSVSGERFSSGRGKSGTHADDKIDASAFHIQSPISEALKNSALTLDDLDLSGSQYDNSLYIAAGFRAKKSKTIDNSIHSKREGFPSCEIQVQDYLKLKITPESHIILAYEDQILLNDTWENSPVPKGFSGGAIIRIDGLSLFQENTQKTKYRQQLTGIITEHHRGNRKENGILIGTRISIHLSLIKYYMPELFNNI